MITNKQKRYLPLKRGIDIVLSGGAIIVLSPVLGLLALAIKLDSPGSVLFKQKRIGKNKELFEIWKFRTMRTDTPSDMPTHMLKDPDQFITKTGKFLRKTSLDELPQIFNILAGKMSVIGPRPALWNQDDLVEQRDKYHANDVTPGLTGWAQINGRDELEIDVKAKFDGDYVKDMGLRIDIKCFLATIGSVLLHDGVVEGGTGELEETVDTQIINPEKIEKEVKIGAAVVGSAGAVGLGGLGLIYKHHKNKKKEKKSHKGLLFSLMALIYGVYTAYINAKSKVQLQDNFINEEDIKKPIDNKSLPLKRVLITGANSYIGTSVEKWLQESNNEYQVATLDMLDTHWKDYDFTQYDTVFHVEGIAHQKETEDNKELYYKVNRDLAVEVAMIAKKTKVKQFVFMSSMSVYGLEQSTEIITVNTITKPNTNYGKAKLQAEEELRKLVTDDFVVSIVRPPMVYGDNSPGNLSKLFKMVRKVHIFPVIKNERSSISINKLCQEIEKIIIEQKSKIYLPQNDNYMCTYDMVRQQMKKEGVKVVYLPLMSPFIKPLIGKVSLINKVFGNLKYEK